IAGALESLSQECASFRIVARQRSIGVGHDVASSTSGKKTPAWRSRFREQRLHVALIELGRRVRPFELGSVSLSILQSENEWNRELGSVENFLASLQGRPGEAERHGDRLYRFMQWIPAELCGRSDQILPADEGTIVIDAAGVIFEKRAHQTESKVTLGDGS